MHPQPRLRDSALVSPLVVLPLPVVALLLSGCPSTAASSDAAQEAPAADTAPTPADLPALDVERDAAVDRPLTCDVPQRTEVGAVGVVCSERRIDAEPRRVTHCAPGEECCSRSGPGQCQPPRMCSGPASGARSLVCDGPEDCPDGSVCVGSYCLERDSPVFNIAGIYCHDAADCPCDRPHCCGSRTFEDTTRGHLWNCSARCD